MHCALVAECEVKYSKVNSGWWNSIQFMLVLEIDNGLWLVLFILKVKSLFLRLTNPRVVDSDSRKVIPKQEVYWSIKDILGLIGGLIMMQELWWDVFVKVGFLNLGIILIFRSELCGYTPE